jgi:hypothetical protein
MHLHPELVSLKCKAFTLDIDEYRLPFIISGWSFMLTKGKRQSFIGKIAAQNWIAEN